MITVRKMLVDPAKYSIKCPYTMEARHLVIHNTANDASANNEISYMRNNGNQVSFHYAIDDVEVVQGIETNRNAWHAGDGAQGPGNRYGVAIEICYSKSGGARFTKAEENAVQFVAEFLQRNKWGVDRVKAHRDFSGKDCPHRTNIASFKERVQKALNQLEVLPYRVRKSWADAASQAGAYNELDNAIAKAKELKLNVYDNQGKEVYKYVAPAPEMVSKAEYDKVKAELSAATAQLAKANVALGEATEKYSLLKAQLKALAEGA